MDNNNLDLDEAQGNANAQEQDENVHIHTAVLWDGTVQAPTAAVAKEIHKSTLADQRAHAQRLFEFLEREGDGTYLALNEPHNPPMVALYQLPTQKMVRLFYLPGIGTTGPLQPDNGLNDKVLALTMDGSANTGPPTTVILPKNVLTRHQVPAMSLNQFKTKITEDGVNYTYPLLRRNQVNGNTVNIFKIAPIPAYLVYDGFTKDLDAAELLERVLGSADTTTTLFDHLKKFLCAVLTSQNVQDNKPHIPMEDSLTAISNPAKVWAQQKFKLHFPQLAQKDTTPIGADGTDTSAIIAQLLDHLAATNRRNNPSKVINLEDEEKKEDSSLKLSQMESRQMLQMCGFEATSSPTLLPSWLRKCHEANMTKSMKMQVVQNLLNPSDGYFDDAEVPLTSTILQMIVDRHWHGKDGLRPSYTTAMDGLSPFSMKSRSDDEIALINHEFSLKEEATNKSIDDLRAQRAKVVPEVPTSHTELLRWLKRYGNLLYFVFGANCPLFHSLEVVIRELSRCSLSARQRMSKENMVALLWIVLLQSRDFAQGNINIRAEFTTMVKMIQTKNLNFVHWECPIDRFIMPKSEKDKKRPAEPLGNDTRKEPPLKQPRLEAPWHPLLKQCLETPVQQHTVNSNPPRWGRILEYCGLNKIPGMNNTDACIPFMAIHQCRWGKHCRRKHVTASEAQATQLKSALNKFITEPDGFSQG